MKRHKHTITHLQCSVAARHVAILSFFHFVILSLFTACVDDDDSPFARRPAFFRFSPVTAAPKTLMPALGNPGEWCTITRTPSRYEFHSYTGMTDSYPLTQLDQYGSPTWVGGLIVGTPNAPEMGASGFAPVVFDLACPNCFEAGGITRSVTITQPIPARAQCGRCHTLYDLENGGIVLDSSPGNIRRLYRYRCIYNNDSFVVQN